MWHKLRALITFLLAYTSVIFFSYDIPCRFLNRSEARMPHVLMRLHHLSLVRLLLHLCHHLELTIRPWWLPYQCLQVLQSWAATQVRIQKGLSAQGPTGPEMKLAYCWRFGVPFTVPWNLLRPLKESVESNFKKISRQVLRSGDVIKQKPGSTQEKKKRTWNMNTAGWERKWLPLEKRALRNFKVTARSTKN